MDDKKFYVEVKGNHMDYDMMKKYNDYLYINLKKFYIIDYFIMIVAMLIFGFNLGVMNIYIALMIIFFPAIFCFACYLFYSSRNMKKPINFIKEVHGVDEMNYNLLFNDYSFKVETDGISKGFNYSKIKKVIMIDGGIFIWLAGLYFVFCDFSKMDTENQEALLKRLRKESKIKWVDKRDN